MTPIYNTFLMIAAGFFAFFVVTEENKCFSRDKVAYATLYENTDDVTKQFYLLANFGLVVHLV